MNSLETKLHIIDTLKNEFNELRSLNINILRNLKTIFDIDFTYNSTAIEGNTFSYQETKVLLLDGITIGGKSVREHLEIINHKEAIDYIDVLSKKKTTELCRTDIFNIHSIILQKIDPKHAGKYRNVPVYVMQQNEKKHIFCAPLLIIDEMDIFFSWLFSEKKEHPIIAAAEAHTRFVNIHPFMDGNGRTGRLLMNLVLLQNGYVPVIIKNDKRVNYLNAIETWQNENKKEDFYNIIADYEKENLEIYIKTIKEKIIWK
jgi:Fic family protein